jgi:hypothetical protein
VCCAASTGTRTRRVFRSTQLNGKWYCHGCDKGGNSIVSFHSALNNIEKREDAAAEIFHEHIHATIPADTVRRWVRLLASTPSALRYASKQRMVSGAIITKMQLGWNGTRITFPIYNEFGLCTNVKMYDPVASKGKLPKMLNYKDRDRPDVSYGVPTMIYPISAFKLAREVGYIVVCEGEWDCLFLLSLGIPAVTSTHGSKSWPKQYTEMFRGLKVIIAYDNDGDGTKYDREVVAHNLRKVAKLISRLNIPQLDHPTKGRKTKDVSEWAEADETMRTKGGWLRAFKTADILLENPDEYIKAGESDLVPLDQASRAQWFNKQLTVDALVTGKDTAPYILPKKVRVSCSKECDNCPLAEWDKPHKELTIDASDPKVLEMLDESSNSVRKRLLTIAGIQDSKKCEAKCDIVESFNVEQLLLIPTLESNATYVLRSAYYVGHGLQSNRAYRFEGITTADPKDQHATHLFAKAKPVEDMVETFQMTLALREKLKVFQPNKLKIGPHLNRIAEWQSRNITDILDRHDLHIAVDLVFHSVASFNFNHELVRRGMLDVLIIGDTRCGKGYVAEKLRSYYGVGAVASGENCSFAGLIGGIDQVGNRRIVKWGMIPLNHNRLVIIDEASAIPETDFGKMSRVRSEGVAEITKIIRETTVANARLLWLSNTRDGRKIADRNTGVMAIKDLMGANEDIARFDFAMTVATDEVDSERINAERSEDDTKDKGQYSRELCRSLILWAWSRRPDQIKFTHEATKEILNKAREFGYTYSSTIPLVQAENIRIKLAKISAAIAARTFSTDASGELLMIDVPHVQYACSMLRTLYSKASMSYDAFSRAAIASSTIPNKDPINRVFDQYGNREATVEGLLQLHRITTDALADYVGDPLSAKSLVGDLVKLKCMTRIETGNWYLKNPAFTSWLREQRAWKDNGYAETDREPSRRGRRARAV